METVHLDIVVTGKVQGVRFRETTKYVADQAGIKGFIRNEPDGSVYIEAEAARWELDAFMEWCGDGPDRARVESCTFKAGELKHFKDFVIVKR